MTTADFIVSAIVILVAVPGAIWNSIRVYKEARRTLFADYAQHYHRSFTYEHRDFDVKGLNTQGIYTLDLERVFVELRIGPKAPHEVSADPLRLPTEFRAGSHTIWYYLQAEPLRGQHLVLLGAPGSGKTTLVKHIGLVLLHRRRPHFLRHLPRWLPVLLFLRSHGTAIDETSAYSLVDAVHTHVEKWKRPMPPSWIERRLNRGQCLILLDGLDEIADPTLRRKVAAWVEQQMIVYGNNRFVVTSRPFGYRSNPLSGAAILEVQPFTFEQVRQFVNNWYIANEIKSAVRDDSGVRMKAQEEAQDLLRRLHKIPALFLLAVNPLLLTMIATVHRYRGSLPGARVTLYKEICEVFLGKRQEARGIEQELRADQRQLVLQPLAYLMMSQGTREIPCAEAEQAIAETLRQVNIEITPKSFLLSVENISGLLVQREEGVYAFAHLTFQEYLAAVHIRENLQGQILTVQVETSWWYETIRLYCAQTDASSILTACLAGSSPSVEALLLAFECLEEARTIQPEIKRQFNLVIDQGVDSPDEKRRCLIAEVLLARRLREMHQLNERISIDTSLVTHAEYQLFLDEQQAQGKHYRPDHWASSSFATGTGRKPVLGVRQSDALAFCEWLTSCSTGPWHYRLPQLGEYEQKDERLWYEQEEVGYWADEEQMFVWSKAKPSPSVEKQFHEAISYGYSFNHTFNIFLDHAIEVLRALDHAHILNLDRELDRDLAFAHIHDLTRRRNGKRKLPLACDLGCVQAQAQALSRDLDDDRDLDDLPEISSARNLAHEVILSLDRIIALDCALGSLVALAVALALARVRALDRVLNRILDRALDRTLDFYLILFLTRERLEGRFPAYEGIRLVKEQRFE